MSVINISFRSLPDSPMISFHINRYFKKLSRQYTRLGHCRAVVELSHKHKRNGKSFSVRLDFNLAGKELFCKKENQNVYIAIRECFEALTRILEKSSRPRMPQLRIIYSAPLSTELNEANPQAACSSYQ